MLILIILHIIIHWNNKFLNKGFTPIVSFRVHNSCTQCDFPCKKHAKSELYGGCSNNNFEFEIRIASNVHKSHSKDSIVKLGSFGHNSLEYYAYFSSLCPCTIIPVKVMGNYLSPDIILLHTCSLGSEVFAWSILSWIMHRNSSFDYTNFVLQM